MLSESLARDVATRVQAVRRRRGVTYSAWVAPPAGWHEIVRKTWPGLIRNRNVRVPDGWVDIVLAMADHLDGRHVTIIEMFEDLVLGRMSCVHTWRRGLPDDDEINTIIDHYEDLSARTCRECGDLGEKVCRGTGRLATVRVLCERHRQGDDDE